MNIKDCKKCINYLKISCPFLTEEDRRRLLIENYNVDCFQTKKDKELCDLMCPPIERD